MQSRMLNIFAMFFISIFLPQCSYAADTCFEARIKKIESLIVRAHWNLVPYDNFIMDSAAGAAFAAASGPAHPGVACGQFRPGGTTDCAILAASKWAMEKGAYRLLYALDVDSAKPLLLILDRITVVENPRTCWVRSMPLPGGPPREGFILGAQDRAWLYVWREGALHRTPAER